MPVHMEAQVGNDGVDAINPDPGDNVMEATPA